MTVLRMLPCLSPACFVPCPSLAAGSPHTGLCSSACSVLLILCCLLKPDFLKAIYPNLPGRGPPSSLAAIFIIRISRGIELAVNVSSVGAGPLLPVFTALSLAPRVHAWHVVNARKASVEMLSKWMKKYKIYNIEVGYDHFQLQDSPFQWVSP